MKKLALAGAALLMGASPVHAQEQQVELSQADQDRVVRDLQVLIGGLQSENIEDEAKAVLISCLYENSLKTISEQMAIALGNNPQIDQTNGSQLLMVMLAICGYQPAQSQAAAPAAASAAEETIQRN